MVERVCKSFPSDEVDLVVDDRAQLPGSALHNDTKLALCGNCEIVLDVGKLLREILAKDFWRAEAANGVATLIDDAPHQLQDATEHGLCGGILRQAFIGDVELHGSAHESLEQRIVKFLGDASAFGETLFEPQVH